MATMQLKTVQPMSDEEFYQFCRENSQYRIEKNKHGKIIIMQPTNSETGNYNFEVSLEGWHLESADSHGEGFRFLNWLQNPKWCNSFARCFMDFE